MLCVRHSRHASARLYLDQRLVCVHPDKHCIISANTHTSWTYLLQQHSLRLDTLPRRPEKRSSCVHNYFHTINSSTQAFEDSRRAKSTSRHSKTHTSSLTSTHRRGQRSRQYNNAYLLQCPFNALTQHASELTGLRRAQLLQSHLLHPGSQFNCLRSRGRHTW